MCPPPARKEPGREQPIFLRAHPELPLLAASQAARPKGRHPRRCPGRSFERPSLLAVCPSSSWRAPDRAPWRCLRQAAWGPADVPKPKLPDWQTRHRLPKNPSGTLSWTRTAKDLGEKTRTRRFPRLRARSPSRKTRVCCEDSWPGEKSLSREMRRRGDGSLQAEAELTWTIDDAAYLTSPRTAGAFGRLSLDFLWGRRRARSRGGPGGGLDPVPDDGRELLLDELLVRSDLAPVGLSSEVGEGLSTDVDNAGENGPDGLVTMVVSRSTVESMAMDLLRRSCSSSIPSRE